MLVPAPGATGSSRDFASGPVIPSSIFPIASNIDAGLDGVLVDRLPGADAVIPSSPRHRQQGRQPSRNTAGSSGIRGTTTSPSARVGHYNLRHSIRDAGGGGWDIHAPFDVVVPEPTTLALTAGTFLGFALSIQRLIPRSAQSVTLRAVSANKSSATFTR